MNKPIIFLGPSLSYEKARTILEEAEYRPPARKGDLLKLATMYTAEQYIVGLVDGLFLQDYPPTPIEVYQLAIRKNVLLLGAASLGALRAVELEKFGMIGIGKIFELYKKGKVYADDEVAVTFAEEKNDIQSEAMIDIRFNLFIAMRKGVIDELTKKAISQVAKSIYFPFRTYDGILDQTEKRYPILRTNLESFRSYLRVHRQSLKERDTIRLLQYIKQRV